MIVHLEEGCRTSLERSGVKIGFSLDEVRSGIGMSERTHTRRRKDAGNLTSEESGRFFRLSRIIALACALFEGDGDDARSWMLKPNHSLDGRSPFEMLSTEVGAREVEYLIGQLEHGVFA